MRLALQHLGRRVRECAGEVAEDGVFGEAISEAEIGQANGLCIGVDQNVIGLDVLKE